MWTLFLLSAATLAFEINLTRLFSVAQFYHFAFMIVSVALLGFGASGTALAIFPTIRNGRQEQRLSQLGFATGSSMLIAYLVTNWLPFDSFSIAWDPKQVWILILNYLALAAPFFFSGMALGYMLNAQPQIAGTTYAVNLLGSAAGCMLALVAPSSLGGEGMVTLSIALSSLAGVINDLRVFAVKRLLFGATVVLLIFSAFDLGYRLLGSYSFPFLELQISPYKSLSYILQSPSARVIQRDWNAFSRVDIVKSESIHTLPGLSYRYLQMLPSFDGLLVDGDDLSPIPQPAPESGFIDYLPNAVAYHLRPQASVLVLEPRGGIDILTALEGSSGAVTTVEINPLIVNAIQMYQDLRVQVFIESGRSYLRRNSSQFDVINLSLTSSFHPVRSGAYSLAEDYRYTVEAFQEILAHLNPDGLFVATRWLQDPPSEDLRLFALALTALEKFKGDPRTQLIAFRGFNTATILLKNGEFSAGELTAVRNFLSEKAFDLTYAPNIQPQETNQYNILQESKYYQTYQQLIAAHSRGSFYNNYAYDIRPPTDDHPFFGHYFKWTQAPQIIAEFGKTWQPFGGAGYFVIFALLLLAVLLSGTIILLPVAFWSRHKNQTSTPFQKSYFVYFGLLGCAFMMVEIPLLQQFILYLGQPAYAFTSVLFSLLIFSGFGSRWSDRIPLKPSLGALVLIILTLPTLLSKLFSLTLGAPLLLRIGLTILSLAPLGVLMGVPFPSGIRIMHREQIKSHTDEARGSSVPWIWGVNGAASVVASILAALLALTFGFSWVFRLGALCYAGVWITVMALPGAAQHQVQ